MSLFPQMGEELTKQARIIDVQHDNSKCAEIINDIAQTLKELPNTQNLSSNQEILLFYLLEARTPNPFTACKRLVEIIEDGRTPFELKRAYNKLTIEEREDVFFAYAAELQHRRK